MKLALKLALCAVCALSSALAPAFGFAQRAEPAQAPQATKAPTQAQLLMSIDDFAGLHRYAADNATVFEWVPKRVVFYGDSITDLWEKNGGTFFPKSKYINRGISGQTTPQMLIRFRQDVIHLHPEAVVILAGTNDIAGNTGPSTIEMIEDNLTSMAELARSNGIRVILASVLPVGDYPWRKGLQPVPKILALNAWMKQYCIDRRLTYLDYYSSMVDADGAMKPGISKDGVHPNAAGYAIMQPLAQAAIDSPEPH